jgi:ribose 5-phosphate isomerase RpiB
MSADGHNAELLWPGRVLAVEHLRRSLNGQRRLVLTPEAIVTPLAAEELRSRGIEVVRRPAQARPNGSAKWGFAQDRAYPPVAAALRALERDGLAVRELTPTDAAAPCRWAKAVAECVARGECAGGAVFCGDAGLVCCVANKVPGLRAAAVATVGQAARATLTLGANLLAVEMPGRTFFEVRQILRTLFVASVCPDGVACTLTELDGHAHC